LVSLNAPLLCADHKGTEEVVCSSWLRGMTFCNRILLCEVNLACTDSWCRTSRCMPKVSPVSYACTFSYWCCSI